MNNWMGFFFFFSFIILCTHSLTTVIYLFSYLFIYSLVFAFIVGYSIDKTEQFTTYCAVCNLRNIRNMRRCVVFGFLALRSSQQTQITRERSFRKLNRFKVISIKNFNLLKVEHGVCIAIVAASCRHLNWKIK